MANFFGLNLRWSTNGVGVSVFGAQALIQSVDNEQQLSEVTVMNQLGNTAIWVGHDLRKSATFEYVAASSATADGNLAVTKPAQGVKFTVADTVDGSSDLAGTNWICQSVVERRMNTDAVKVTVRAIAFPSIT